MNEVMTLVHKPSCAYLCSGDELPPQGCDCGADPQRRIKLSMGVRSCQLLLKAIGRLDGDEVKEAERLGLVKAMGSFLATTKNDRQLDAEAREFGVLVEELWQKANMHFNHPLELKNVWGSIKSALDCFKDQTPEQLKADYKEDEPLYGIGHHGQYHDRAVRMAPHELSRVLHVFVNTVVLGLEPDARVTVGIKRGSGTMAEYACFWPELRMKTALWSDHAPDLRKWAETKADDRITTTRRVAERLMELLAPDSFLVEARAKG